MLHELQNLGPVTSFSSSTGPHFKKYPLWSTFPSLPGSIMEHTAAKSCYFKHSLIKDESCNVEDSLVLHLSSFSILVVRSLQTIWDIPSRAMNVSLLNSFWFIQWMDHNLSSWTACTWSRIPWCIHVCFCLIYLWRAAFHVQTILHLYIFMTFHYSLNNVSSYVIFYSLCTLSIHVSDPAAFKIFTIYVRKVPAVCKIWCKRFRFQSIWFSYVSPCIQRVESSC